MKRLALLAAVVGALAAFPGVASAASCNFDGNGTLPDPSIVDSAGFSWDIGTQGDVGDGYNTPAGKSDAFDTFGALLVSADGGATFKEYKNPDIAACTVEENGHLVGYPDDTTTVPGVALNRRVYVAASGLAFARWVDSLTNTTAAATTVIYRYGGNFGSDGSTTVADTSSGDGTIDATDSWANTFENPLDAGADPAVTNAWDGISQPKQRASKAGLFDPFLPAQVSDEDFGAEYSVTLAPGETKRFMHVLALRLTAPDQAAAAAAIAVEPNELRAALTPAEESTIQNWTFDRDADGVLNFADNCPSDANPGQENLDGDAKGDACDDDIDGDGLTNSVEQALRTDSRNVDTDGDGKADGADSCPTLAGATDEGCPAPVDVPALDKTAPLASVGIAKKVSLKQLLRKGVGVKLGSNEPAAFDVEVAASVKSARLAQVGDLIVSAKKLAIGSGTRSLKLTIAKKFRKALTPKSRLRVRVVATDAAGNRTVSSIVVRLKK